MLADKAAQLADAVDRGQTHRHVAHAQLRVVLQHEEHGKCIRAGTQPLHARLGPGSTSRSAVSRLAISGRQLNQQVVDDLAVVLAHVSKHGRCLLRHHKSDAR